MTEGEWQGREGERGIQVREKRKRLSMREDEERRERGMEGLG